MNSPKRSKKEIKEEMDAYADKLMGAINEYFAAMDDPEEVCCKKKLDFFIDHKHKSPGRRQTEEIEPDVSQIRVMEL